MPAPYTSWLTAVQGIYFGLDATLFPGGVLTPGPFLDEAPVVGTASGTERLSPPYVLIRDLGGEARWTFTDTNTIPGQNAINMGGFVLEAYDNSLGVADSIMAAILWNGQVPNNRHGLAFATLQLIAPQAGIAGCVIPTKDQRQYTGFQYQDQRVHVVKQWFKVQTAIVGG